jgi:hypothetical protein
MLTIGAQFALFLSSFSPLFVIFGLLGTFGDGWQRIACYAIALVSVLAVFAVLRAARSLNVAPLAAKSVRPRDSDVIAYVVTYIVPFVAIPHEGWQMQVAIAVFIGVIAALYVSGQMFYINPILGLRYRLFELDEEGRIAVILTRRRSVSPGTTLMVRRLSEYVFIEFSEKDDG